MAHQFPKYVYFVGIGGIGMSALVRYFAERKVIIAGYDKSPSQITEQLMGMGISISFEDTIQSIPDSFTNENDKKDSWVIYTPAIPKDSEILNYFTANNYLILKRAQALGFIAENYQVMAIAGTHGKTTTSTALAHIMNQSKWGCISFLGGISKNYNSNFIESSKEIMVVEADEYDRSFHQLKPQSAVITSVDSDHLDIYGTYEKVQESFQIFASKISDTLIVKKGIDTPFSLPKRILTYSTTQSADYCLSSIQFHPKGITYVMAFPDKTECEISVPVYGLHNAENTLAAAALAHCKGLSADEIASSLSTFTGVVRRFDIQFSNPLCTYIDDYAHHPEEIKALAMAVKAHFPQKKSLAIFQPHLYTRTRDLYREFAEALSLFDKVILLDIYPARELPIVGINSESIAGIMPENSCACLHNNDLLSFIENETFDVIITLGAGDIDKWVSKMVAFLKAKYE